MDACLIVAVLTVQPERLDDFIARSLGTPRKAGSPIAGSSFCTGGLDP